MNWGWKMAAVYIGFVGFMLTFVFIAKKQKIDLVTPDYYAEEIRFKERIDAIRNAQGLRHNPSVRITGEDIEISYPDSFAMSEGTVKLYCPHDAAADQLVPMQIGRTQIIPGNTLRHGQYSVALMWQSGDKSFYHEETVFVP